MVRMKIPGSVYRRSIGKWVAQTPEVYDPDRHMWRRVSLGTFSTKDQAEMELRRFNEKLGRSKALSTAEIRSMRVDRYLDDWLESVIEQGRTGDLAARTVSGYESAVRLHINPVLGRRTIADLDERVVVNWLGNLRRKGLADRTVLRIFRTAQRAFGDAPLDHNPFNLPKRMRPRVRQERRTYRPSLEEVTTFLGHVSACDQSIFLSVLWRLAATTGMRRGELVGVEWTDVDLDAGRLSISRSIVMDGSRLIVKPPKSQAGRRVVGLDSPMITLLTQHRDQQTAHARTGDEYDFEPLGLDLVFRWNERGEVCRPDRVSHRFKREWNHAGLTSPATLHSLRHFLGSLLLSQGHSITDTAQQMGHDPHVLLAIYAGVLDEEKRVESIASTVGVVFS